MSTSVDPPAVVEKEGGEKLDVAETRPRKMSDAETMVAALQRRVTHFFNWMGPSQVFIIYNILSNSMISDTALIG